MRFRNSRGRTVKTGLALAALYTAPAAHASIFKGETLDAVANGIAWVVLAVVPIIGLAVFWMVHVLPEKIAEKRHHPQKQAIHTLCLLSLVFGGLLWPIAWLWAYTRPVTYKAAYGTDKHEDYYIEMSERAARGELEPGQLAHLREEFAQLKARGQLTPELMSLYDGLPPASAAAPVLAPAASGAG